MNKRDILKLLTAEPFVPFRIRLADGKTYDIRHPELLWVFSTRLEIARPAEHWEQSRELEDSEFVGLLHVVRTEPLTQSARS